MQTITCYNKYVYSFCHKYNRIFYHDQYCIECCCSPCCSNGFIYTSYNLFSIFKETGKGYIDLSTLTAEELVLFRSYVTYRRSV